MRERQEGGARVSQIVRCGTCGLGLNEPVGVPLSKRELCPNCGGVERTYEDAATGEVASRASLRARVRAFSRRMLGLGD
jgi:hypothetical protein